MGRWWRRVWYFLNRSSLERELDREMASHRAMMTEPHRFGSTLRLREQSADVWGWTSIDDLRHDLRYGARLLVKDWRFTLAAVAALALGLGAATTAFTFVNGAITDLPLANPDGLVWIRTVDARGRQLGVSHADARDWREAARTLSHLVVSLELPINVAEETLPPQRYPGSYISFDAFTMVGRAPILGRAFTPDDDRIDAPRVAIIAHTVWQSRYGGDAAVIGRIVRVNDVPATIVGVMPEGFHFPYVSEIWVPVAQRSAAPNTIDATRGNRGVLVFAFGRLADEIQLAQAQAEMDAIADRLAGSYPATNAGISVALEPIEDMYWGGEFGLRRMLLVVMAAVTFVLLIACVNVANLLLARGIHRSREIAIRTSLGATRRRIVRQLFVESLLLAAVAGSLGFIVALYGVRIFQESMTGMYAVDGPLPFWLQFSIDGRVYAFLGALCLGTTLLFGLAPALHVSKAGHESFKDGGRNTSAGSRTRRWTGALVVTQLALTLALLAGAGLMLRSFLVLYQAGQVLDTSNIITMQVALPAGKYRQPTDIKQFFRQLDERLASVRALSDVTVASDIPMMTVINALRQLAIEGRAAAANETPPTVAYLYIGPRYFETLGLRLLEGRSFTDDDGAPGRETAIVNERFASMFFPDGDPVGQRIRVANAAAPNAPQPWFTIVGIAPTVPQVIFRGDPEPVVYVSLRGEPAPHRFVSIIARAEGDRASIVSMLREAVRAVDSDLPGYYVRTLDETLQMSRWRQSVLGSVFALVACIALVLASVGVYAVIAHSIRQRTQEIGVRVALGARSPQVVWLFVRRTFVDLGIALVVGLAGAIIVGRLLEQFLVRTAPTDPLALGLVSLLLIVVAMTASVWPARRAARIDPLAALRHES